MAIDFTWAVLRNGLRAAVVSSAVVSQVFGDGSGASAADPAEAAPRGSEKVVRVAPENKNEGESRKNDESHRQTKPLTKADAQKIFEYGRGGLVVLSIAVHPKSDTLMWLAESGRVQSGKLVRARLDGTAQSIVADELTYPRALTIDPNANKVYWASCPGYPTPGITVWEANLDGAQRKRLVNGLHSCVQIAANPADRSVYWHDDKAMWQYSATENLAVSLSAQNHAATVFAINFKTRDLYSIHHDKLMRESLDGEPPVTMRDMRMDSLTGFFLDEANRVLYWSNVKGINRARLDDLLDVEPIVRYTGTNRSGFALDLRDRMVYWVETGPGLEIFRAHLPHSAPMHRIEP